MCGIVGYIGKKPAAPLLLEGLSKLEYRGYDSAGVALLDAVCGLHVEKAVGRLSRLAEMMHDGEGYPQTVGIGHTRWATHGRPSDENAHPQVSRHGRFAVVHNGIIENYAVLRERLIGEGVTFTSETDTEVIAQLLERHYTGDFGRAVRETVAELSGSYALGILCADCPDEMFAVRNASPLIIGVAEDGCFIASDIPAILRHTRRIVRLSDHETARLTRTGFTVFDASGAAVERTPVQVDLDVTAAEKGGYAHFMLKEIMEQPQALANTISPRLRADGSVMLDGVHFSDGQLADIDRIVILACGSAWHAGMVGKVFLERMLRIPVEADLASEFRYRDPIVDRRTLAIVISQSGETADTLAALREAKARGARVLSIVNVVSSTIAEESDDVLYTWAGPEIAVATTKGYTTQVAMLYLIGIHLAVRLGRIDAAEERRLTGELRTLPRLSEEALRDGDRLRRIAAQCRTLEHAFFLGRGADYAVALEASLKLKEISYIHSEAYAAGELKHGTISLIEDGTFVVALACEERLIEKTVSNIREVKARGAHVLAVTDRRHEALLAAVADEVLVVPDAPQLFSAVPMIVPLQLLSYEIAVARGCDVDKPRNLAKSVTVE